MVPLRYLATFSGGGTPDRSKPEYWNGTIPWVSPKDMKQELIGDSEEHITEEALDGTVVQLIAPGAVLVVVRGMILARSLPVALTTAPVTINQDIKAIRCGQSVVPRFLQAVLQGQSHWLLSQADQSAHGTRKLETDLLRLFEMPCPSLAVQQEVVGYLERETERIDELVGAKEGFLKLLAEKRQAIVTSAVTRGLDPAAPLRDSGTDRLAELPAHWSVRRMKHLLRSIEQGWSPECQGVPAGGDEWGVMKAGCCNGGVFRPSENKALPTGLEPKLALQVRPGDVLMSRASGSAELIGSAARVPANFRAKLLLSDKLYRLRALESRITPGYLAALLGADVARWQIRSVISGAAGLAKNVTQWDIGELRLPVPPLEEQHTLENHIARATSELDAIRAATERTIDLLTERRAALIAAAVTSQIDPIGYSFKDGG